MTDTEYAMQMDMLLNATRAFVLLSQDIPLDDLLAIVRRAETLGPIIDPTKWMRGGQKNLNDAGALISAAIQFRASVSRVVKIAEVQRD